MKKAKHLIEYALFIFVMQICAWLPLDKASAFVGWLGRNTGPFLRRSQRAENNLEMVFPELDKRQIRLLVKDMWDNLGRVFAEYPHLEEIGKNRVTIENAEHLEKLIHEDGPAVFVSAHTGNWEISGPAIKMLYDHNIDPVYRAPNNPYVDKKIAKFRGLNGKMSSFAKSSRGARDLVKALKNNRHVAIIFDQKYNQGPLIRFFGVPAKTSTAFADLALKFKCPVVPGFVVRDKGAHFKLCLYPPISLQRSDGSDLSAEEIIAQANTLLEELIRRHPSQWLWLHRRWPHRQT